MVFNYYVWASAAVLLALFGVWNRNTLLNMGIKLLLLGLGIWGVITALH